jgi:hypothetical protein
MLLKNFISLLELKFQWQLSWRRLSSGEQHHVVWQILADVSEEFTASITLISEAVYTSETSIIIY